MSFYGRALCFWGIFVLCFVGIAWDGYSQCFLLPPNINRGSINTPDKLCSPVTATLNYSLSFADAFGNPTPLPVGPVYDVIFIWGDGTTEPAIPVIAGSSSYTWTRSHTYPTASDCEYKVTMILRVGGFPCSQTEQIQFVASWRTDMYNYDGNVQLLSPITGTRIHEVCEGEDIDVEFLDNTQYNCNQFYPTNYSLNEVIKQPNQGIRWQQIIYNTNTTIAGDKIPNVDVDGINVTGAAGIDLISNHQDTRGVVLIPPTVDPGDGRNTLTISAPGGYGAGFPKVGDEFEVTIRYWNVCNPYANDGDLTPVLGNLIDGDNPPVEETAIIRIIDAPERPDVNDVVLCYNDNTTLTLNNTPTGTINWYATLGDALGNTNVLATAPSFAINTTNAPVGVVTDFFVTAVAGNSCVSDIEQVFVSRREQLTTPPLINPKTTVCTNETIVYSLATDPAVETVGGATEYVWSIVPAGSASIVNGQGTRQVTVQTNGTLGNFNLRVERRYTSGSQCTSLPLQTIITVVANPSVNPVTPVNLCEGTSGIFLDGNYTNNAGFTIPTSNLWTGNVSILSATDIEEPDILLTAPAGTYNLTYTYTNSIGCSSSAPVVVNISTNPAIASVGSDQSLCGTLVSNPMGGSNPAPGVGLWSFVSSTPARPSPTISNVNDPSATISITLGNEGAYIIRWTVTNGSCSSFADIIVDLGSDPTDPIAGNAKTICGENTDLEGNTPIIGIGTWSIISGPGGCLGAGCPLLITDINDPISATQLVGPSFTYGAYILRWTIQSGSCPVETDDVQITFNEPALATVPANFTTCVDQASPMPITLSSDVTTGDLVTGGSTQGHWEVVSGLGSVNGNLVDNATLYFDEYQPIAGETSFQVRMVANDPDGAGLCAAVNSSTLTVTIDRKPADADAGTDFSICEGTTAQLNATAANNGGAGVWSGTGGSITDNSLFNTTVTGLTAAASPYTFTWTVTSALDGTTGACTPTTNDVIVTVNPLPAALDPAPNDLCTTTEGLFVATNVTLSTYDDDVTGAAANRTVEWFATPADQIAGTPTVTVTDITNSDVLFTTVTDTSTPNLCSTDGSVTFTVNGKPDAIDNTFSICEELPIGSNTASFDLTDVDFLDDITSGVPDRTVTWHSDEQGAIDDNNLLVSPNTFSVTGTTIVYARVVNTVTGCFNVAEITLTIKSIPRTPSIVGKLDPCRNGTELYRAIDPGTGVPYIGGATYAWTYPTPDFEYLGGGNVNDFYLLLTFPNTVTNDLKVKVTVNGCESSETTQAIVVSPDPVGYVIIPNPDDICEDAIYPYSVSPNNATSTYNWQVLTVDGGGNPGPVGGGLVVDGQTKGDVLIQFFDEDVFLRVTESNASGCAGPATELRVTVNKRPVMDDFSTEVCSGEPAGIILTNSGVIAATSFHIQVPVETPGLIPVVGPTKGSDLLPDALINDTYKNQTIANALSILYRVTPISAVGCEGDARNVTLNVKAEPVMDVNLGKTVCSDAPLEITLKTAVGFLAASDYEILSINADAGLVELTPTPAVNTLLNANAIFNTQWQNTTTTMLSVTYMVRPYSNITGCYGNPAVPVVVNILPKPIVDVINDFSVCSGDVLNIPLSSSNIPGTSFVWSSLADPAIIGSSSGTTSIITDQLINTSLAEVSVTYEIRGVNIASTPVCTGAPETVTITVRPSPEVITPLERTVCSNAYGSNTYVENLTTLESSISTAPSVTFTWFTDANDFTNSQIALNGGDVTAYMLTDETPVLVRVLNTSVTSGCYKDATVIYKVNPTPELTLNPVQTTDPRFNITCNGLNNGQVAVSALFGTNHTFNVDGGSLVPALLFSNLTAGDHVFQTRNTEGCLDTKIITLIEPDPIVPNSPSVVDVSCFNDPTPDGQIVITASGGTSTGGDPLNFSLLQDPTKIYDAGTNAFHDLRAGTYTVRVEDKNGCTEFVTNVIVGQPADVNVSIDITSNFNGFDVSCAGATDGVVSVTLISGGTPNFTYQLDQDPLNVTGVANGVFTGLPGNTLYSVTATDSKGCQKSSLPVFVGEPIALVSVPIGFPQNVCEGGDPVSINELAPSFGGIGNYTFLWEESTDDATFAPATGVNDQVSYDPGVLLADRYYRRRVFSTVAGADPNCPSVISESVKVTVRPLPTATLNAPDQVCEGGFFTLDFAFPTGQSPFTFEYTDGTNTFTLIGAETRPVPILNYTATTRYTLNKVSDFYGCEVTNLNIFREPEMINMNTDFTIAPVGPQCVGVNHTVTFTRRAFVEYTITWNDGTPDTVFPAIATTQEETVPHIFVSANVNGNTVYPVTLTARSTILAACSKQSPAQNVTILPAIFINVVPDRNVICSGESINFVNSTQGGSSHRWFYYDATEPTQILSDDTFTAASSRTLTFENNTTQNPILYDVVYQVSNGNGCPEEEEVMQIRVYRGMTADFTYSLSDFQGGGAFATFQNTSAPLDDVAFRYEWEFGVSAQPATEQLITPNVVRYSAIGDKEVRLTVVNLQAEADGLTCTDSETELLTVLLPPLVADFEYTPQSGCFPTTIEITKNLATGDEYEWRLMKNGETINVSNDSVPSFEVSSAGSYIITLTTSNSITGQSEYVDNSDTPIQIELVPFAAFEPRPEVVYAPDSEGMKMLNRSARASEFFWDFGDGGTSTEFDPRYFYQVEGNYTITLIASENYGLRDFDGDGSIDGDLVCRDTTTYDVIVKETGRVRIPNAFTPDASGPNGGFGDGLHNDVFRPVMTGVDEFLMQIFDRWGNLIFESRDTNQGWDGYDKDGRLLPAGVYVYKLTMRLSNNSRTTQVGDVTLIR